MKQIDIEKERMKRADELIDAIGEIKDEFIVEAATDTAADAENVPSLKIIEGAESTGATKKKRVWPKILSAAAVLVLCVGVGTNILGNFRAKNAADPSETAVEASGSHAKTDSSEIDTEGEPKPSTEDASTDGSVYEPALFGTDDGRKEATNAAAAPSDEYVDSKEGESEIEADPAGDIAAPPEEVPYEYAQGEAFVLTAGQWNDNANWPFFTNLVNAGHIGFPSFGIDPRNRIVVTVTDEAGSALANELVALKEEGGEVIWQARTNKDGIAYLFIGEGLSASYVEANGVTATLEATEVPSEDPQGSPIIIPAGDEITIVSPKTAESQSGVQVMFIVDTTGSMGDELAYLQMDFAQIAADTAGDGVSYSVNFYRDEGDEYVTRTNSFTADAGEVQRLIASEYAAGGGDTPEAVADILAETITNNSEWRSDMNKVCFLIFDAPPHYGTEATIDAAARAAAERGIHVVPVVASNAERETELFGRALAIVTDGEYVFLTDDSGVGNSHLEPIIGDYSVELLHDIIVRIINGYK